MNPVTRKPLVAGNWKMHGSTAQAGRLVGELITRGVGTGAAEAIVCPGFVHLAQVRRQLEGSQLGLGAQDVCAEEPGAHTGEVSAAMLADVGCRYVIVGHSERRQGHGETDALVAAKARAVLDAGMTPIVCVGETLAERDAALTETVVGRQIDEVIESMGRDVARIVVAYEPVWAIGTGRTATPEQAQAVHALLRSRLAEAGAAEVALLYGGSVKAANAAALFAMQDVDGGLVGGASLDAGEFLAIGRA